MTEEFLQYVWGEFAFHEYGVCVNQGEKSRDFECRFSESGCRTGFL